MSCTNKKREFHKVLTIAGSDSGGGAGIQADLKTMSAIGCYGMSVITALTAQNTRGVTGIHAVPPSFAADQIAARYGISVGQGKNAKLYPVSELLKRAELVVAPFEDTMARASDGDFVASKFTAVLGAPTERSSTENFTSMIVSMKAKP